jgi:hypothetical protein
MLVKCAWMKPAAVHDRIFAGSKLEGIHLVALPDVIETVSLVNPADDDVSLDWIVQMQCPTSRTWFDRTDAAPRVERQRPRVLTIIGPPRRRFIEITRTLGA